MEPVTLTTWRWNTSSKPVIASDSRITATPMPVASIAWGSCRRSKPLMPTSTALMAMNTAWPRPASASALPWP
ncbi:hypothetical protein D3C86_1726860 [compost metagenome]